MTNTPVDAEAFSDAADAFRGSVERAMKRAYQLDRSPLTQPQHALAIMTGCLTAAVAEFARLQAAPTVPDLRMLEMVHKQVDTSWEDAMRLLSDGQA